MSNGMEDPKLRASARGSSTSVSDRWTGEASTRSILKALLVIANVAVVLLVWGWQVEPRWVEAVTIELAIADLPSGLEGMRIVQVSDLHLVGWSGREDRALRLVSEAKPDVVVLTGDLCDGVEGSESLRRFLAGLSAPLGVFAIVGNMDEENVVIPVARGAGVRWLLGEATRLQQGSDSLLLLGGERPAGAEVDRLVTAHPGRGPRILLAHSPDVLLDSPLERIDLILTGHTHGGQIRIPFVGAMVTMTRVGRRYASGLHRVGATWLYVNRGLGTSFAPVRFACRPEVATFVLRTADPR